jgi:selenide,water dikinase
VVGRIDPGEIVSNAGAGVGDVLVLTKPIGVGVLATALKEDELAPDGVDKITELMATLNRAGSEAMLVAGASAATDVTGFGLVGHATEMADASDATLEIVVGDVPLVPGALAAVEKGLAPGGLFSNQHYYSAFVDSRTAADGRTVELMYDPQTSGGLLIAISEERLGVFEQEIAARGGSGSVIGRVVERGERAVVLK